MKKVINKLWKTVDQSYCSGKARILFKASLRLSSRTTCGPWIKPGVIPEPKANNQFWASLHVAPKICNNRGRRILVIDYGGFFFSSCMCQVELKLTPGKQSSHLRAASGRVHFPSLEGNVENKTLEKKIFQICLRNHNQKKKNQKNRTRPIFLQLQVL